MMTHADYLWVTMNLDDNNRIAYAGPSRAIACRVAAALVGNNSPADTGEIVLYGPGDGSTAVMVRQLPAAAARTGAPDKAVAACRAVLNDLHNGDDRGWRAGPWADPNTPDGEGGTVAMLRAAVAEADGK